MRARGPSATLVALGLAVAPGAGAESPARCGGLRFVDVAASAGLAARHETGGSAA